MGSTPAKVDRKKRLRGFIPRRDQPPDPWSIQPGVVWEFIARTKTASGHLYRGLPDGPGISVLTPVKVRAHS